MVSTVVVLGGRGLLGQALMHELVRRGLPAVAVSRATGVDLSRLGSPQALAAELNPLAPGLVINAAAITELAACERDPDQACALHARLPGLLSAWARDTGVPWVQVSTDHYFCGTENRLHDEQAPVMLMNQYARSKYAGERLAILSRHALVLRTNVVGRRGWAGQPSFAEWVVQSLRSGQPFAGYVDSWASSLEAGQCASALLDLVDTGARGLVNLASAESISKADFMAELATAMGLDTRLIERQPRPQGGLTRANTLGLNVRCAQAQLGRALPDAQQVALALAAAFKETELVAA